MILVHCGGIGCGEIRSWAEACVGVVLVKARADFYGIALYSISCYPVLILLV